MDAVKQIEKCLLIFFLKLGASILHLHYGKFIMFFVMRHFCCCLVFKIIFMNRITVPNSLDPDLGTNHLQRLSADDTSRQIVN